MNCPTCQQSVSTDAVTCPHCQADLTEVVVDKENISENERSQRPAWLVFGGVAVAVLALGAAAWGLVGGTSPTGAEYAGRIPAEAVAYVEIDVAELTSDDSKALLEAFAPVIESNTGEEFDIDSIVEEALGEAFDVDGIELSFSDDIASWATGPIAMGMLEATEEPQGVVLMGGDDPEALDAFLSKIQPLTTGSTEIGGVEFLTVDDGGQEVLIGRDGTDLVVATDSEAATSVVDPGGGETLADDPDFTAQLANLPADAAMVFAVNGDAVTEAMGQLESEMGDMGLGLGSGFSGMTNIGPGWTAGSITTASDSLQVDYVANQAEDAPLPSVDESLPQALPGDTIAFFRTGMLLDQLETLTENAMFAPMAEQMEAEIGLGVDQILNVFSVDGAVAVWPSTEPELPVNAALVGVSDENQSAFVDQVAGLAETMGVTAAPIDSGYLIEGLVGLGTRDALTFLTSDPGLIGAAPEDSFADSDLFARASDLVEGNLQLVLDVPAVIDLVDGFVAAEDPEAAEELACLPLGVAAAATQVEGETVSSSFVLEIATPDGC